MKSLVLLFITLSVTSALAAEAKVLVLRDDNTADTRRAYDGFVSSINKSAFAGARYQSLTVRDKDLTLVRKAVKDFEPSLILALGVRAAELAVREAKGLPVVIGVLQAGVVLPQLPENTVAVTLPRPLERRLQWIRRIVPEAQVIGVIYNNTELGAALAETQALTEQLGFRMLITRVDSPREIPDALRKLERDADVIWALADDMVNRPETARAMLLSSFRSRIPLVSSSPEWVRAGALFSLDWDFNGVGARCGEFAVQLLSGETARRSNGGELDQFAYTLNLKTLRYMNLDVDDAVIGNAQVVYQ